MASKMNFTGEVRRLGVVVNGSSFKQADVVVIRHRLAQHFRVGLDHAKLFTWMHSLLKKHEFHLRCHAVGRWCEIVKLAEAIAHGHHEVFSSNTSNVLSKTSVGNETEDFVLLVARFGGSGHGFSKFEVNFASVVQALGRVGREVLAYQSFATIGKEAVVEHCEEPIVLKSIKLLFLHSRRMVVRIKHVV